MNLVARKILEMAYIGKRMQQLGLYDEFSELYLTARAHQMALAKIAQRFAGKDYVSAPKPAFSDIPADEVELIALLESYLPTDDVEND